MPPSRKRKAAPGTAASPAVAAAATAAPYNPLRDRDLLGAAVQKLAAAVANEARSLTAMEFCVEVLHALGLPEVAIGQAERIFISSARKAALGERDAQLVAKPPPAAPVVVPRLEVVAAALREFRGSGSHTKPVGKPDHSDDFGLGARLDASLDAAELRASSLVHLRGFVSPAEAEAIARGPNPNPNPNPDQAIALGLAGGGASSERATALRESSGTGRNGAYGAVNLAKVPLLRALDGALRRTLREKLGCDKLGDKVLVTRYAEGGVNWAHQDQSEGAYQAYLLLSRPGLDFTGGGLYIADPAALHARAATAVRPVEWSRCGDLVIFAANSKAASTQARHWLHGFREVRPGSEAECQLCVVGLLE